MAIRSSVFGSKSERHLFQALRTRWSDRFDLWHNLPFLRIFDLDLPTFEPVQRGLLTRTNVDITYADKSGKPILSIEYDGIGEGFSRDGKYVQEKETPTDPARKLKMDLKLRIAKRHEYPFFVLGSDEAKPISGSLQLCIADGIVGQVLAQKKYSDLLDFTEKERVEIQDTPSDFRDEFIEDLINQKKLLAQFEWDPLATYAAKIHFKTSRSNLIKSWWYDLLMDHNSRETRTDQQESAKRVGCTYTAETQDNRQISRTVWVNNVNGFGINSAYIAMHIANVQICETLLSEAEITPLA